MIDAVRSGLSISQIVGRLEPPTRPVRAVLDTDTYNEIDDQFALVYSLLSPEILLEAVYAAPFWNARSSGPAEGMELSFREIERLLALVSEKGVPVGARSFRGSAAYMASAKRPVESGAASDLVERAMRQSADKGSAVEGGDPLYVLTIGAPTNVASAILLEPGIARRIVVVWLGGHPPYWHTASEFNLKQDIHAARILLDSGVPLVLVPCKNVAEHLRVTAPELDHHLGGRGPLAEYLRGITVSHMAEHGSLSKAVWDIAVPAWPTTWTATKFSVTSTQPSERDDAGKGFCP